MRTTIFFLILSLKFSLVLGQESSAKHNLIKQIYCILTDVNSQGITSSIGEVQYFNELANNNSKRFLEEINKPIASFLEEMENSWQYFIINDLQIIQLDKNTFLTKGFISGKNLSRGNVSYMEFQHLWWFRNGEIEKYRFETTTN